jgi:hypothetical protein
MCERLWTLPITAAPLGRIGGGPKQTHPITGFSGDPPKRVTISGWDSLEKLKGWQNDPEFVQLLKDMARNMPSSVATQ